MPYSFFQNLLCCSADVLESKSLVQVAITVVELAKVIKSSTSSTNGSLASTPTASPNTTLAGSLGKPPSAASGYLKGSGGGAPGKVTSSVPGNGNRNGTLSTLVQQTTTTVMSSNGRETTTRTMVNSRKVLASNKTNS